MSRLGECVCVLPMCLKRREKSVTFRRESDWLPLERTLYRSCRSFVLLPTDFTAQYSVEEEVPWNRPKIRLFYQKCSLSLSFSLCVEMFQFSSSFSCLVFFGQSKFWFDLLVPSLSPSTSQSPFPLPVDVLVGYCSTRHTLPRRWLLVPPLRLVLLMVRSSGVPFSPFFCLPPEVDSKYWTSIFFEASSVPSKSRGWFFLLWQVLASCQ